MNEKVALITGLAGQDGSYLAELLISKGYTVHGLVRRNSVPEHQESRVDHLSGSVVAHYSDLLDRGSLTRIIDSVAPDEIYNLGAQSHVRISFEVPDFTSQTNALGPLSVLEILRGLGAQSKFYQASSSEMFGDSVDEDLYQRETTPMHPVSPYGCSKLFGYHITRNYRKAYGMFAANGILFNHESPRRGSNFVTSKIIKTAVEIKLGKQTELVLGNLDSHRDWGHSKDYVRAMTLILNHNVPDDFVIATGETRTVRELLSIVFEILDLNYLDFVRQDPKYMRPEELPFLRGDSSKARTVLGWKPEISFEDLVQEMISDWFGRLSSN
jgi:GDPmannose 4,6-dehydratase